MVEALREPPNRDLWLLITEVLRESVEIDRRGSKGNPTYTKRSSAQFMLHNLVKILSRQPYFQRRPDNLSVLLSLSCAMFELDHGRVHPVLKPCVKKSNNAGDLAHHAIIKGTAARALSEFIDAGEQPASAAKKIARALRGAAKLGLKAGNRGEITWKTITGWRERLNEGPDERESPACGLAYRRELGTEYGASHRERADNLLNDLRQHASKLV